MSHRTAHRACPRGANHRHRGPLPPERAAHISREARRLRLEEKRSLAWLASHFGITITRVKRFMGRAE